MVEDNANAFLLTPDDAQPEMTSAAGWNQVKMVLLLADTMGGDYALAYYLYYAL